MKVNQYSSLSDVGQIEDIKTGKAGGSEAAQNSAKGEINDKKSSYSVNLSHQAKDLKEAHDKAYKIAKETPAVREDRVAELKKKITSGQYKVDSGKIADGILNEAIREHLALTERS